MVTNVKAVKELALLDKRLDLRSFTEYRQPIQIETDLSWTAEGSAKVTIGKTVVMAGVKLAIENGFKNVRVQIVR